MNKFKTMLRISEHPNADLVNGMPDEVISTLESDAKPVIHADYAEFGITQIAAVIIGGLLG